MKDLIYVEITLHFEVTGSPWHGAEGEIGYTSSKLGGIDINKVQNLDDDFIKKQIKSTAEFMKVAPENIKLISKEEHEAATENDEYCEEGDDYEC